MAWLVSRKKLLWRASILRCTEAISSSRSMAVARLLANQTIAIRRAGMRGISASSASWITPSS